MTCKILDIEFRFIDGIYKRIIKQPCDCDCHGSHLKHIGECCHNGYNNIIVDITPQDIIDSYNIQKEYLDGALPNCNWLIMFLEIIEQINYSKTWRGDFVVTVRDNNCFFYKRTEGELCSHLGDIFDSKHASMWKATHKFMNWFVINLPEIYKQHKTA